MLIRHLVVGFLMGSADVVPGVSGGTVALVGGVYSRLVDAIREGSDVIADLGRGRVKEAGRTLKRLDWALVAPLGAGILTAVITLASALERLLENQPVRLGGAFFGLVAGSAVVAFRMLRKVSPGAVALAAAAGVLTFFALGLAEPLGSAATETQPPLWAFPASGVVAITAMILPGISGSFMLVSLGMYDDVLGAVTGRDLVRIALFAAGCVAGLALFSRLLSWLIKNWHDAVVATMIGLMLGSVRILWPWPGGPLTSELGPPAGDVLWPAALGVAGFLCMVVLGSLGFVKEEGPEKEE